GLPLLVAGAAAPQEVVAAKAPSRDEAPIVTYYRTKTIDGMKIFYREAGPANAPVVLLLHGFPTSSHMFRNLIPELADRYHVIAPDYPGFGQSDMQSLLVRPLGRAPQSASRPRRARDDQVPVHRRRRRCEPRRSRQLGP